jgi:hyaluronan synthase
MQTLLKKQEALTIRHKKPINWDLWEPVFRATFLIFCCTFIIIAIKENIFFTWEFTNMGRGEYVLFRYLLFTSGLIFVSSLIFRTYLWFRYRGYSTDLVTEWPEITVVVPAYNEGETIYNTICSIARCDYPKDKLKIIAVDDGSTDSTPFYMNKARTEFPHLTHIIRFPQNRGKRQGIYAAFKKVKTPFMISVDSDTRLEPNALKEILSPLILNEKIGAVTGRIKIWNSGANIFTKMLNAHFAMAFDFTRAVQSTFSTVFCLSGAFSAYRVSIMARVIERWINQKFLNITCTYGEDRSLTNHILKSGLGTFYQRQAISSTIVPEKFRDILKMLTRWARSNIRESIIFSGFMFNKNRKGNRVLPFIEFFCTYSLLVMHFFWFYYFLCSGFVTGNLLFRVFAYSILFGFFYVLYYLRIEGKRDFPYIVVFSLFSTIFMVWIFTSAGLTLTKKGWSTR